MASKVMEDDLGDGTNSASAHIADTDEPLSLPAKARVDEADEQINSEEAHS